MITENNPSMNSTAESIFLSNSDFVIREQCRRREEALVHEAYQKKQIEDFNAEVKDLSSEIERLHKLLEDNGIKDK